MKNGITDYLLVLTGLFIWFICASTSGFGSLKLGTSENTIQNLRERRPNVTQKLCSFEKSHSYKVV